MSADEKIMPKESMRYKQVKLSTDPQIAYAFKNVCMASDVSMASVLSRFMADYAAVAAPKGAGSADYGTKRKRRAAVCRIIRQLEQICEAECSYRDSIPANLQNSVVYERAEEFIAQLEEAADALEAIATA